MLVYFIILCIHEVFGIINA